MKIRLTKKGEIHVLTFTCDLFRKIEENYEEVEISMYEELFLDLNCKNPVISLLEKYDTQELIKGLLYFGAENELEKLSMYLQKKNIEDFFTRKIMHANWCWLSENPSLSEAFFEKHIEKVSWFGLSQNLSISEAFFEKHIKNVKWGWLTVNSSMTENFFEKHVENVFWDWVFSNPSISETFFEKHIEKCTQWEQWIFLSGNPAFSEAFFEKHLSDIYWPLLCQKASLSEAFFEKHLDMVKKNWQALSQKKPRIKRLSDKVEANKCLINVFQRKLQRKRDFQKEKSIAPIGYTFLYVFQRNSQS